MRDLLNAMGFLGIRHGSSVLFSIVRAKLLALLLGPAGVGFVSQALNLHILLWTASTGGLGRGTTVLVAGYEAERDFVRLNRILTTALVSLGLAGVLLVAGCALLAEQISLWTFGAEGYGRFVLIVAAASWFAIQSSLVFALFRALLKIREYSVTFVIGHLVTLAGIVPLIHFFGLTGAILSILLGQVANYLAGMAILEARVLRQSPQIGLWRERPGWESARDLFRFFGPLVMVQVIAGVSNLLLRGQLIGRLGVEANGYYQVVWGISTAYMAWMQDTNQSYLTPRISSSLDSPAPVVRIQNDMIRVCLLLLSPFLVALYALREIWIPLLYSKAFLVAGPLLLWQFVGDLLTAVRRSVNAALIPYRRFTFLVLDEGLWWGGWIGLSLWLMPRFQLMSIPLGYLLSSLAALAVSLVYQRLVLGFRIEGENIRLLAKLLPLLLLGFAAGRFIPSVPLRLLFVTGWFGVGFLWLPSRRERARAVEWIVKRLRP